MAKKSTKSETTIQGEKASKKEGVVKGIKDAMKKTSGDSPKSKGEEAKPKVKLAAVDTNKDGRRGALAFIERQRAKKKSK